MYYIKFVDQSGQVHRTKVFVATALEAMVAIIEPIAVRYSIEYSFEYPL